MTAAPLQTDLTQEVYPVYPSSTQLTRRKLQLSSLRSTVAAEREGVLALPYGTARRASLGAEVALACETAHRSHAGTCESRNTTGEGFGFLSRDPVHGQGFTSLPLSLYSGSARGSKPPAEVR